MKKPKHKLIIKILYDAQAECSCGNWYMCFTGELTKDEIRKEFRKHLKKYRKEN